MAPLPFPEFIVKVHSSCDLPCDYCYVYEMADQSWPDGPRVMSPETAELTSLRIGEHAVTRSQSAITLILHGGEPLLTGQDLIARPVTATGGQDRHRRFVSGRGSYAQVTAALRRLRRLPYLYSGLLCTLNAQ